MKREVGLVRLKEGDGGRGRCVIAELIAIFGQGFVFFFFWLNDDDIRQYS